MKRGYMLVTALTLAFACHAQEGKSNGKIVKTEPNGVVVYEAPGVDRPEDTPVMPQLAERQKAPTFEELNQSELEQRIIDVERKLERAKEKDDTENIARYEQEKLRTSKRIEAIKTGNN